MDSALDTDAFVSAVERRVASTLSPEDSGLDAGLLAEAARHLCLGHGGKRLRPRLVLLLGRACGVGPEALENLATAAELVHAASLLHDDVVDEGQLRRGRPTANARWGNAVAVLAGDWLLATAFKLLAPYPRQVTVDAVALLGHMSIAAVKEIEARGLIDLTAEEWQTIAEGKTGALFAWCGSAVACISEAPALVEPLTGFGMRLGVAFQLADDIKDLRGCDDGKDRFADVRNRNPSLPILMSVAHSPELRQRIGQAWALPEVPAALAEELGMAIVENGAIEQASQALEEQIGGAIATLDPLSGLPLYADIIELALAFSANPSVRESA